MSRPRSHRFAAAAVFAIVLLVVGASTASADTTVSTYHAKADASALNLQLLGQGVTLGLSHADVANDPKASSRGVGVLLPGPTPITDEKYDTTTDGETKGTATPPACGPISLPRTFPWSHSPLHARTRRPPSEAGFQARTRTPSSPTSA